MGLSSYSVFSAEGIFRIIYETPVLLTLVSIVRFFHWVLVCELSALPNIEQGSLFVLTITLLHHDMHLSLLT